MNIKLLEKLGLLYTNPTQTTSYTYTPSPTDDIDIMRMLDGRTDFYCLPAFLKDPKKKKIIITDPSFRYKLGTVHDEYYEELFQKFKDNGFEFSVWVGKLVPVNTKEEFISALKYIEPIHDIDLGKHLSEKGISIDECYFCGIGQTCLLVEEFIRTSSKNKVFYLQVDKLNQLTLGTMLESIAEDPIVGLKFNEDNLSYLLDPKFLSYLKKHPAVNLSYSGVTWKSIQEFVSLLPSLQVLNLSDCNKLGSTPDHFSLPSSLKMLDLSSTDVTWNDLKVLLKNCPALEVLNLTYCNKLGPFPKDFSLPKNLNVLNVSSTKIQWDNILSLIKDHPKLELLDLRRCLLESPSTGFSLPENIRNINLSFTNVTWDDLGSVLKDPSKIESLNLSDCRHLGSYTGQVQLPKSVKSFDLSSAKFDNWEGLVHLIKNASLLESFSLNNCSFKGPYLENFQLPKSLRYLNFAIKDFPFANIVNIIKNCHELEKLTLRDVISSNIPIKDIPVMTNIRSIDMGSAKISWDDFKGLIDHSPHLESLILSHSNISNSYSHHFSFPKHLKELYIADINITWNEINTLLRDCSLLQTLQVAIFSNLGPIPRDFSLPQNIRKVNFEKTNLTWNEVGRLLKDVLLLEELKLDQCKNLGNFPDNLQLPKNIRKISLSSTLTTWDDVAKLIQCCPNLERLMLDGCDNLGLLPPGFFIPDGLDIFFPQIRQEKSSLSGEKKRSIQSLDPHTGPSQDNLWAKQVFYQKSSNHPDVNHYRLKVYNDIAINQDDIKLIDNENPTIDLIKNKNILADCKDLYEKNYVEDPRTFLGEIEIARGSSNWIPLPSLTPKDKLLHFNTDPHVECEVGYCKEEALYYIKPKQPLTKNVNINFLINADLDLNVIKSNKKLALDKEKFDLIKQLRLLPNGKLENNAAKKQFDKLSANGQIQLLIDFFNSFSEKEISDPNKKGIPLYNAIIQEQAGVCRHRAMAFTALAKALKLPVRAIYNDVHAFVEVSKAKKWGLTKEWYTADLGGGVGNLTIAPLPKLKVEKESTIDITSQGKSSVLAPDNRFRVWDTVPILADNMDAYAAGLVKLSESMEPGKKNILSVIDPAQIESFHTALLQQKKSHCYYLHDLDQITDKTTVIGDGSYGSQDSHLATFIKNAKPGDVLLVNWSQYEASHVGYNSIMDATRLIKGIPIPEGVIVIGLLDKNQTMGEDFYSRFRAMSRCPDGLSRVSVLPTPTILPEGDGIKPICFYDDRWQATLLGQAQANDGLFYFNESEFLKLIQKGETPIVLKMAPWHLPEFRIFITELLSKRELVVNGKRYEVSPNLTILRDDTPYVLDKGQHGIVTYTADMDLSHAYLLNKMTLNPLFQRYTVGRNHQITTLEGLIKEHAGRTLTLFVTESLSNEHWAHLLQEAKQNKTKLHIIKGFGVSLPKEIESSQASTVHLNSDKAKLIETNDIDFAADMLERDAIVISVNEKTTYADLVGTNKVNKGSHGEFDIQYQKGWLTQSLLDNKPVVIKGRLSMALAKQLETLFLPKPYLQSNGERIEVAGKLTIITDQNNILTTVNHERKEYNPEEIWDHLQKQFESNDVQILKKTCQIFYQKTKESPFSYVQLRTMLKHIKDYPDSNPLKSVLRSNINYINLKESADSAWKAAANKQKVKNKKPIIEKRIGKLQELLKNDWFGFVVGSSGVGKSTTIQQAIKQMGYTSVEVMGSLTEKLKAWCQQDGIKRALFIDEANLFEPGAFDVLESLYANPPYLLLDGVYYPVPQENRLIFAGNFGHFRGRQELNFVTRHGNIITFKEFEDDFLRNSIMHPICEAFKLNEENEIKDYFIKVYRHLNQVDQEKHPMTTRNLQMMIMRYVLIKDQFDKKTALAMAAYEEASGVLNQNMRRDFSNWIKMSQQIDVKNIKKDLKEKVDNISSKVFRLTKKRKNPVRVLNNLMRIREDKINVPSLFNAGSSGLILESSPGEGKSLLALQYLQLQGFVNGDEVPRISAKNPNKRYYHLHTADPSEIDRVLRKAFDEGAVLVVDEMNTLPLEHVLNFLMSGNTPEGIPPTYPGFFIIATQNPIHFSKRQVLSEAFLNRFQKLDIKNYDRNDLNIIINFMLGNDGKGEAEKLVDEFINARNYARENKISREPVPRDLFEAAQHISKNRK